MLTMEQLKKEAPSVFATQPWNQCSENYKFVPTIDVVNALTAKGFVPMKAAQSRTRIPGKADFTRHIIRFRHQDLSGVVAKAGDHVPEIVLMNSHDRSSAYKIMLGIFRFVCGNGMIVASSMFEEICARHSGRANLVQEVIDGSYRIVESAPIVTKQIEDWRNIELNFGDQMAYALAAQNLRDTALRPKAVELLSARRNDDQGCDLWHTFNKVQENVMRGGMQAVSPTTRRLRNTSAIKSVNEDVKFNRKLWAFTEQFAREKIAA